MLPARKRTPPPVVPDLPPLITTQPAPAESLEDPLPMATLPLLLLADDPDCSRMFPLGPDVLLSAVPIVSPPLPDALLAPVSKQIDSAASVAVLPPDMAMQPPRTLVKETCFP